jgi:hypothetical protein
LKALSAAAWLNRRCFAVQIGFSKNLIWTLVVKNLPHNSSRRAKHVMDSSTIHGWCLACQKVCGIGHSCLPRPEESGVPPGPGRVRLCATPVAEKLFLRGPLRPICEFVVPYVSLPGLSPPHVRGPPIARMPPYPPSSPCQPPGR